MSILVRPDSGTKTRAANQRDVSQHISQLQQELTRSRGETQRARDKLSCLISLVRRSWNGDRNASIHLANIIGLDIPPVLMDSGTAGRPGTSMQAASSAKTVAEVNWERLALKLLQRDYELMQREIHEHQQRYIENRSRFMDEVLHHHQKDMARTPLSRPSSGKLTSLDQQFLQVHSAVRPDGRNALRQPLNRPKSSAVRTRPKVERDVVQQAEVKLRELFVESSSSPGPPSTTPTPAADACLSGTKDAEPVRQRRVRMRQDYDDARRYVQGNLFRAEDMVSQKPRPMSAAMLREKDRLRARPKSAVTFNMNAAVYRIGDQIRSVDGDSSGDRPLKYETTRPVSGKKPLSAKARSSSFSVDTPQHHANGDAPPNINLSSLSDHMFEEQEDYGEPVPEKAPISVRVKNAITRPECVDRFSQDLRHMEEMEAMFKMNTLSLQKKLGLPESGIV